MTTFKFVGDGTTLEETFASFVCGMMFGATSVIVGHPLDTVKTRMQADPSFRNFTTANAITDIAKQGGIPGFYRGMTAPLLGSMFFRSIQFASYGAVVTYFKDENHPLRTYKLGGVEARVFLGGATAGICRSLLESPLDLIKTRRQTGAAFSILKIPVRDLFRGFSATLVRNVFLLGTFFVFADRLANVSSFTRGGISTTAAWTLVWPLDVAKSRMQSVEGAKASRSLVQAVSEAIKDGSMYRGYTAGIARSFIANGAALQVYGLCQELREKHFSRKPY